MRGREMRKREKKKTLSHISITVVIVTVAFQMQIAHWPRIPFVLCFIECRNNMTAFQCSSEKKCSISIEIFWLI